MKNLLKIMEIRTSSLKTRFYLWMGYKIGCWRSVSEQLRVLEDCSENDLKNEISRLINICCETGTDTDYLKNIISVRLSAAILRYLEISGFDKNKRIITKDPEILKNLVQSWGNITIQSNESGYKYNGKSGCYWMIDDILDKKRFQLFTIIQIRKEEGEIN